MGRLSLLRAVGLADSQVSTAVYTISVPGAPVISGLSPGSGAMSRSLGRTLARHREPVWSSSAEWWRARHRRGAGTGITVAVPAGAATGNVGVTVGGVASNGVGFTVTNAPAIYYLSPMSGPVGTTVTVAGANFGAAMGASTLTVGGVVVPVLSSSDSSIQFTVPASTTGGNVLVTVGGQTRRVRRERLRCQRR